ncbi:MAG: Glutamine--tRNA ligase [candidate division TA06 bacterium ADurb.Bin131]|uniref:Glutamine--tRNA ligase n=1 Tax=candidate division TA06 bacterium ADurb.Bin131 TaxID=1852827 RepID=A0A1V6CAM3_UNCT6|nr:MAG: Glutamine--tRNA ligase [candidate division TA06 bacterium ADurb.Bin131]
MENHNNSEKPSDFIREFIKQDIESGRFGGRVHTRFPPEPNGYLHIGHAKAICLNFDIAKQFNGKCNLRFDDTNPTKEEYEYVEAIKQDIKWLGYDWEDRLFFASDYFEQMYEYAVQLIKKGKAYVCDLTPKEIKQYRGTLTEPGKESPYRNRTIEENLLLFEKMKQGEFPEGSKTLRAKIDMTSSNLNMRDPVMYRIIKKVRHHRTGGKWFIYPTYDWAHGLEDSIEKITHSLCSLEYENHRPLYDWFLDQLDIYHPRQIEFARLNMTYTIMSKRYLGEIVKKGIVNGWDDPRMPTLAGMRRAGYPPEAIRKFCDRIGVAKTDSIIDIELLEHFVRENLNKTSQRRMVVLKPLKLVIENYPEKETEQLTAINNPENPDDGTRKIPFSKVLYIDEDDFMESPKEKFYRLAPGREVRLRYAYFVKCTGVVKDDSGRIIEVRCTYDPATRGGDAPDGRKSKVTLHWVSAYHCIDIESRLYGRLFLNKNPMDFPEGSDFTINLNPESISIKRCKAEPSLKDVKPGDRFQFERSGYFVCDPDSKEGLPVFNLIVSLKDEWEKIKKFLT